MKVRQELPYFHCMNKPLTFDSVTVTAKGQVTLRRDLLSHLGVGPGDRLAVEYLPAHRIRLRRAGPKGDISVVFGMLADKTDVSLTIEEMNDVIASAWAGRR